MYIFIHGACVIIYVRAGGHLQALNPKPCFDTTLNKLTTHHIPKTSCARPGIAMPNTPLLPSLPAFY